MYKYLNKMLLCIILFLFLGIICKRNSGYRDFIKYKMYEESISFSTFLNTYNKYFGSLFPLDSISNGNSISVFNEGLVYNSSIDYMDGVMLDVGFNYLVPNLEDGIVIYKGIKEKYGNVVIVEGGDGINIWYGNICNDNVLLYDHLKKGDIVGESCDNYLYLLYNKDNKFLDYNEYME